MTEYWIAYTEYEVVHTSLRIAKALRAKDFKLKTDSKLVV